MTKGSDLFVAALENEGVQRVFGVPGEENLDTVESLRTSSIDLVVTRHEQSAAFMAATYGRLTGRPGVCISTLGPGALNLATGAAYAHLGAMPMILVTGQKAIRSSQQARFQIIDMVATMKPLTKFSRQIVSTSSIPTVVREAFRVATEERPGPVHLELPEDVAGEEVDLVPLIPPHPVDIPVAHPAALDRADLIVAIGHDTIEKPPFIMGEGGPQVIHVGYMPANVEQFYAPQAEVIGDVGPSLALLADRLQGKLQPGQSDLLGLRVGILDHINERATEDRFPATPQRLADGARAAMPGDG